MPIKFFSFISLSQHFQIFPSIFPPVVSQSFLLCDPLWNMLLSILWNSPLLPWGIYFLILFLVVVPWLQWLSFPLALLSCISLKEPIFLFLVKSVDISRNCLSISPLHSSSQGSIMVTFSISHASSSLQILSDLNLCCQDVPQWFLSSSSLVLLPSKCHPRIVAINSTRLLLSF